MDNQKQQLTERLKQAQNILVTVSKNPSVDQLSAAIGLTLVLNHLDKHGTAVFSGQVPSTLEFLKPEDTLEKNTDSLRDFIIALDKSKADKLRYKVENDVVRIFITPYKTSISEKDLDFSQGDFNVDVVIALGVREQQDLDGAITSHGRILHDATVASISLEAGNNLGSINWVDTEASSLSELVVELATALDKKVMDTQIATALLTGIVAATERFRNDKTTPKVMSASAELMAAGANQQLIASELENTLEVQDTPDEKDDDHNQKSEPHHEKHKPQPGTLEIHHIAEDEELEEDDNIPEPSPEPPQPQIQVDEDGKFSMLGNDEPLPEISTVRGVSSQGKVTDSDKSEVKHERLLEPPSQSSDMTANSSPESFDPASEELTLPPLQTPILSHNESVLSPAEQAAPPPAQPVPMDLPQSAVSQPVPTITADETLAEIERLVDSPHMQSQESDKPQMEPTATVDDARSAVEAAFSGPEVPVNRLEPIIALNAQPLGSELRDPSPPITNTGFSEPTPGNSPADATLDMPLPGSPLGPQAPSANPFGGSLPQSPFPPVASSAFPGVPQQGSNQSNAPPPVPPPMLPPLQ
jgi:hypothetical protein